MSYWQDHGIQKKEFLGNSSSHSSINPNVQNLFTLQSHLDAVTLFSSIQQRQLQQGLPSENVDSILNQLFQEAQQQSKGTPPASKEFIEKLESLNFSEKTLNNRVTGPLDRISVITCAVCLEELYQESNGKKLPCRHCFHADCILSWLKIHNTCPSCRQEFPTDDVEYERAKRKKAQEQIKNEDSEEEWDPFYS